MLQMPFDLTHKRNAHNVKITENACTFASHSIWTQCLTATTNYVPTAEHKNERKNGKKWRNETIPFQQTTMKPYRFPFSRYAVGYLPALSTDFWGQEAVWYWFSIYENIFTSKKNQQHRPHKQQSRKRNGRKTRRKQQHMYKGIFPFPQLWSVCYAIRWYLFSCTTTSMRCHSNPFRITFHGH